MPYAPSQWETLGSINHPTLPDNVAGATGAFAIFKGRAWFGMGGATGDDGTHFPRLLENGWGSIHSCKSNLSDWRTEFTFANQSGYISWVPRALGVTGDMLHCLASVWRRAYFTVSEPSCVEAGEIAIWSTFDGNTWFKNETLHQWPLIRGPLGIGTSNSVFHSGFFFSGLRSNNGADRYFVVFRSAVSGTGPGAFFESYSKHSVYRSDDEGRSWVEHKDLSDEPFTQDGNGNTFNSVVSIPRGLRRPERMIFALSNVSGPFDELADRTVLYSNDGMETLHAVQTEDIGIGGGAQQILDRIIVNADRTLWGVRSAGTGAVTRSGGSCDQGLEFGWSSASELTPANGGTGFGFGNCIGLGAREIVYTGVNSGGEREFWYSNDGGETWTFQGASSGNFGFPGVTPGLVKMPDGRLLLFRVNPIQFGLGMSNTFTLCSQMPLGSVGTRQLCLLASGFAQATRPDCGETLVPNICEGALLGD